MKIKKLIKKLKKIKREHGNLELICSASLDFKDVEIVALKEEADIADAKNTVTLSCGNEVEMDASATWWCLNCHTIVCLDEIGVAYDSDSKTTFFVHNKMVSSCDIMCKCLGQLVNINEKEE